jgi:hypothetical protein
MRNLHAPSIFDIVMAEIDQIFSVGTNSHSIFLSVGFAHGSGLFGFEMVKINSNIKWMKIRIAVSIRDIGHETSVS